MKITVKRLQEILLNHKRWTEGVDGGQRANLEGANLEGAYLRGAYLRGANLEGANLEGANLEGAYLEGAYLRGAYLRGANPEGANLRGAYLRGAYLRGANMEGAYGEKIEITKAPLCIGGLRWLVTIWDTHMQIGCEFHSHDKWSSYDDARIGRMASSALAFWAEWKSTLLALCAKHGGKLE